MTICAGVVLFNPDLERLQSNLEVIIPQVKKIYLIDNASDNILEVKELYKDVQGIVFIENFVNMGIAKALNQLCSIAIEDESQWIYLLDQDSISSPSIIESYEKFINLPKVALLTPFIVDINKLTLEEFRSYQLPDYTEVEWAITSGSMINLKAWGFVGGFYEDLFIDGVDFEYSLKLNLNSFKQYRINKEYLLQEVGKAEPTFLMRPHKDNTGKWSLKRHYSSNHSLLRYYYMIRNKIIITKKYRNHVSSLKAILFLIAFAIAKVLFEKNRFSIMKTIYKGVVDGMKFKTEKYNTSKK